MAEKLRFRSDGSFRILMVSDIQEGPGIDPRAPVCYRKLVEHTKPDFIVWGGDNIDGRKAKTADELRSHLSVFAAPAEEAGIPWAFVFGNHDYDMDISPAEQASIYAEYPGCLSRDLSEGIHGTSNFAIPVYGPDGRPAYAIYGFDTAHKHPEIRPGRSSNELLLPGLPDYVRKWDTVRFDQLAWYVDMSRRLEREAGAPVRALAVMHVPPYELQYLKDCPELCSTKGETSQRIQAGVLNTGIYATMYERGDVECIAAGHLHESTIEGEYGGIRLCLDGCAGFSPKSLPHCRGGRVFDITLDGGFSTDFIPYQSIPDTGSAE